jgi:transposase
VQEVVEERPGDGRRAAVEPQRRRCREVPSRTAAEGIRVRVGMEATGYSSWFERLLTEPSIELWIGDPAEIKAKRVKKQKTDRKDAELY